MERSLKVAIVCPCYNEEDVVEQSCSDLIQFLDDGIHEGLYDSGSFVLFVDDGSSDKTWTKICLLADYYSNRVSGLRLSRNSGHQNALCAGLQEVTGICDACVTLDVDLQDDLSAIKQMIIMHRQGAEIVLGVKRSRRADPLFKRATAYIYYRLMRLMGVDLVIDHADCRLLSRKVLEHLSYYKERALFLRGLQMLLHSNIQTVSYDVHERRAGKSKYGFSDMFKLALDGMTSFSIVPLRVITAMGFLIFVFSLAMAIFAIIASFYQIAVPGWASTVVPIYVLGGLLMLSMGILGEYLGKIFVEVKQRPRFLIDERTTPRKGE